MKKENEQSDFEKRVLLRIEEVSLTQGIFGFYIIALICIIMANIALAFYKLGVEDFTTVIFSVVGAVVFLVFAIITLFFHIKLKNQLRKIEEE